MAITASLLFAAPAMATTVRYVDDTGGDDGTILAPSPCTDPSHPCLTINHAIGQAAAGDSVDVAAGTYTETVNVTQRVRLEGAQAGVDARTRSGAGSETIVDSPGGDFNVTTSGASIDGFVIRDATTQGVALSAGASGYSLVNNIIRDNTLGVSLNSDGAAQTVLRHNAFIDNNQPGASSGDAIYGDAGLADAVVDANSFTGHTSAAIVLAHQRATDVSFTGNTLTNDNSIVLYNVHGGEITGNTSSSPGGSAVYLGGGNADVDISGNDISGSPTRNAINVTNDGTFANAPANTRVNVIGNRLAGELNGIRVAADATDGTLAAHFNRIVGNANAGVFNEGTQSVDAKDNWWGCLGGPGTTGCDGVSGPVDATTWLVLTAVAERGRVLTGGDTTAIRAGFARNSSPGTFVDASEFPASPISFSVVSPPDGSVSPSMANTSAGIAQTVFKSGATASDTASVTATLDNGSASAAFVVSSQAGPQGLPGANGTNGTNGQDGATGPQGPAGPEGPSTPSSPAQPNPVLILSNSLRATKKRIVSVSINCPLAAGLCDGRLGIGVGNLTLGNTAFLVNGGNRAVIRLRGGAGVIRTAIKKKKVTVVVLSRDNAGTAALTTKVVKFRR